MQNTGIQYLKYVWNLQSLLASFDMWVFRSLEFLELFILKFACIPWGDFSTQRPLDSNPKTKMIVRREFLICE